MPEFAVFRDDLLWTKIIEYNSHSFRFISSALNRKPGGFVNSELGLKDWPTPKKWMHITKLIGAELIIDNEPVSKFKRAAVGTLVFGGIGTIAGLVSGFTARPKAKISVALQMDDFEIASFTTRCYDIGTAYRLLNTLAKMEKDYYESNPDKLKMIESKSEEAIESSKLSFVFSDEITKLKQMLDDGIIDQEEFKEMKKVLIDKSKK